MASEKPGEAAQLQKESQICPYCGVATRDGAVASVSPPAPATTAASTRSSGPSRPRQYRALIVDDQADFRRLITFTLEHSGLPIFVIAVGSGREALERAQDDPPDLIILDVMMPGMDGFEVCERLRSNERTAFIPILMLTALDDPANHARGFLSGTDDYVGKPFARADFLARVRRLIERAYEVTLPADRRAAKSSAMGASVNASV